MRILHVIPAVAPRYGGPSVAVFGMAQAMLRVGADVTIVTTDADGDRTLQVELGSVTTFGGVDTVFFHRRGSESFKWASGLTTWMGRHVNSYDVVHVHAVFSHACWSAGRLAARRHVPFIVRPLGTLDPWSLARHAWRKQLLFSMGLRGVLSRASALHYTSEAERTLAHEALPWLPGGVVVPLGLDDRFFLAAKDRDVERPYVLAFGRIDPKKGIDVLIRAFHEIDLSAARGHWRLVIAGDGDPAYVTALRSIASSGMNAHRIEFAGWQDAEARIRTVGQASVLAMPSHQENFGLAAAEAMACGVPVVVTPGVNLAHDVKADGAGWVVPRDVQALAQVLGEAVGDGEERGRRGARAQRLAARFRWSAITPALTEMYESTSASRRGTVAGRAFSSAGGRL